MSGTGPLRRHLAALGVALLLVTPGFAQDTAPDEPASESDSRLQLPPSPQALAHAAQRVRDRVAAHGELHLEVVEALQVLGRLQTSGGQHADALRTYQQALAIADAVRGAMHPANATLAGRLATAYRRLGNYSRAEQLRIRALRIVEAAPPAQRQQLPTHLNNLAVLYKYLGQYGKAEPLYRRAIAAAHQTRGPDSNSVALFQSNLAEVYRLTGRPAEAQELLRDVLVRTLAREPESRFAAFRMTNLARLYASTGRPAEAEQLYRRSHAILVRALGSRHPTIGGSLTRMAALRLQQDDAVGAEQLLREALGILELADDPHLHYEALRDLARLQASAAPAQAIFLGKLAVNTFQKIRRGAEDLDEESQQSLLEGHLAIYQQLSQWLIDAGRLAEAEEVVGLLKQRELQELTRRTGPGPTELRMTGSEVALARQHAGLGEAAVRSARELEALNLQLRGGSELTASQQARRQELQSAIEQQRAQLQAFFAQLQQQMSGESGLAQLTRDQAERGARQMQTLLRRAGPGHVGLQYVLTEERLSIILSLPEGSIARQVPLSRTELNRRVAALRQALRSPAQDARPAAQALHAALIAPVAAELAAAGAHTLVLSLTDVLRYVPFAALHDRQQFLVERYAIALHTPAAGQAVQPAQPGRWQVAGLGLTRAVIVAEDQRAFSALPAVADELRSIVRSAESPAGALPGEIAMNADFTRARLEAAAGRFPVLHIASHFQFAAGSEHASYLVLGDGQRLPLADIKEMDFTGVDLLTLSACDTGSGGGRNERGSEVEGLGAAVQLAGARSVLATLWPVADASTALLMQRFYADRATAPTSTAEALRRAQLALLTGSSAAGDPALERGARRAGEAAPAAGRAFRHPFFWAPFILMGSWL